MSTHQIVCTEQTRCTQAGHIISVGTGTDSTSANAQWTVREVWDALDRGEVFYTYGGGEVALVHKFHCPCGRNSLRSAPDATIENNLDYLRLCRWKAA